jgi:cytochrome P450
MKVADSLPTLPFGRSSVLELPLQYRELQERSAVTRVRTPAGDLAWLVTRHDEVRTLLAHPALGRSHPDPEHAARYSGGPMLGGPIGNSQSEDADHQRMRHTLSKAFSARRIEALRPRVQAIVDELLTALARETPPSDLHEALSFPLPALVICELLGVPYDDRAGFRLWSTGAMDIGNPALAKQSMEHLVSYMRQLIEDKRQRPGQDVISDMVDADKDGRLTEQEAVQFAAVLLVAGHETTVARIDFGVLLLLTNPDHRDALGRNPAMVPQAVEEILRMSIPGPGLTLRYARSDIDVDGVTIREGELVLLCTFAANRDSRVFKNPDSFDITRTSTSHVAFGYGPHFCLGAGLARVELQCAFATLLHRFPTLRVAVPVPELRLRGDVLTGGFESLPVAW